MKKVIITLVPDIASCANMIMYIRAGDVHGVNARVQE